MITQSISVNIILTNPVFRVPINNGELYEVPRMRVKISVYSILIRKTEENGILGRSKR
jgi:hypothetical protein